MKGNKETLQLKRGSIGFGNGCEAEKGGMQMGRYRGAII